MMQAAWRLGGLATALTLAACLPLTAPMGAPDAPATVRPKPTTTPTAMAPQSPVATSTPSSAMATPSVAPTTSIAPASQAPSARPSPFPHFYYRTDAPVPASPEPGSVLCGDAWNIYERFSDDPLAVYILTVKNSQEAGKLVGSWNAGYTELRVQAANPTTNTPIAGQPTYVLRPLTGPDFVRDFTVESGGQTFYLTDTRGTKTPCQ